MYISGFYCNSTLGMFNRILNWPMTGKEQWQWVSNILVSCLSSVTMMIFHTLYFSHSAISKLLSVPLAALSSTNSAELTRIQTNFPNFPIVNDHAESTQKWMPWSWMDLLTRPNCTTNRTALNISSPASKNRVRLTRMTWKLDWRKQHLPMTASSPIQVIILTLWLAPKKAATFARVIRSMLPPRWRMHLLHPW